MSKPGTSNPTATPGRAAFVRGNGPVARAVADDLQKEGWTLAPEATAANLLVFVTQGRETDAAPIVADLRAFAGGRSPGASGGIVLILDLSLAQPRASEPSPPFAEALALRSLLAALPLLALEFAPHVRVNAIGTLPAGSAQLPQGTPDADIAAALRFIIDAPALTGQMIALDGGRTALVPAPGSGTSEPT